MEEANNLSVGEKIKEVREAKGLSLQELAEKTGYTSALVNQIENHLESPPLGALGKIAHALEVDIGELWGDHGDAPYAIARKGDARPVNRVLAPELHRIRTRSLPARRLPVPGPCRGQPTLDPPRAIRRDHCRCS